MEINTANILGTNSFLPLPNRERLSSPFLLDRKDDKKKNSIGADLLSLMKKPNIPDSITSPGKETDFKSLMAEIEEKAKLNTKEGDEALKKSCDDFEAILVNFLLTEMQKTVEKSSLFGEDKFSSESYNEMLNTEISKSISQSGSLGISEGMYRQLTSVKPNLDYSGFLSRK